MILKHLRAIVNGNEYIYIIIYIKLFNQIKIILIKNIYINLYKFFFKIIDECRYKYKYVIS